MSDLKIPDNLKPRDGRFGCGPSKMRPEALDMKLFLEMVDQLHSGISQLSDLLKRNRNT